MVTRRKNWTARKINLSMQGEISQEKIFVGLLVFVMVLFSLNVAKASGYLLPEQRIVSPVSENVVLLSELTLEQKTAQMVVVAGGDHNLEAWKKLQVGGIHLYAKENEEAYRDSITRFQEGMAIPFFVTVDYEGCLNPFAAFHNTTTAREIHSVGDAFEKGYVDGAYLAQMGFSINFAPVVDLDDQIWGCRAFPGNARAVSELSQAYILGLQEQGVMATAKHYPGKTLVVRDPHKFVVEARVDAADEEPYVFLKRQGDVSSFMVSHLITTGAVDSQQVPAVVSYEVVSSLKEGFNGLIISDEINMLGLRHFYDNDDAMYVAVFKAGNDLVLNFNEDPQEVYHMIQVVAQAVERGEIASEQIDTSVRKILEIKGFEVRS